MPDDQDAGASQDASAPGGSPPQDAGASDPSAVGSDNPNDGGAAPDSTATGGDPSDDDSAAAARGDSNANALASDVTIEFDPPTPVACPGINCLITAKPSEPGGTFEWSVAGGTATLTDDDGGGPPSTTSGAVNFFSYNPDNTLGFIPQQSIDVNLQYTPPGGDPVTVTLSVTVHEVNFSVDSFNPQPCDPGVFQAIDGDSNDVVISSRDIATIAVNPAVSIQVDSSCTANGTCASNYQLVFLQTVNPTNHARKLRFTNSGYVFNNNLLPLRDSTNKDGITPPYASPTSQFNNNNQVVYPVFVDYPKQGASKAGTSVGQLREIQMSMSFTVWLVARNIGLPNPDIKTSLVFLRNFDWNFSADFVASLPAGAPAGFTPNAANFTPTAAPTINVGFSGNGQGSNTPLLDGQMYNDLLNIRLAPWAWALQPA